jgi:uncharacterized membrane protein
VNLPFSVRTLGIGFVAGLRSMTAPAAVLAAMDNPLAFLGAFLAAGELVADKLPATPSRLIPPAFGVRILSGGYCGFALADAFDGDMACGAGCGVVGAVAGTFAGSLWRTKLGPALHLPDLVSALVEDAVAIGGALALTGMAAE